MANMIDELNILSQKEEFVRRAIPFRDYFKPMDINKEQKERRVRAAERIAEVFYIALGILDTGSPYGELAIAATVTYLQTALMNAYAEITDRAADAWYSEHALRLIEETVAATGRHPDDPYFTSDDRADVIAENDAAAVIAYDELAEAVENGFVFKTWHGMLDKRERKSHVAMEGTTIPIDEPFDVNGSQMMMPGDDSLGASPAEIVNCRCWLTFS